MNAKVARQIEEMKKQTIGVEVEMNSITRRKAAKLAAEFFSFFPFLSTYFLVLFSFLYSPVSTLFRFCFLVSFVLKW